MRLGIVALIFVLVATAVFDPSHAFAAAQGGVTCPHVTPPFGYDFQLYDQVERGGVTDASGGRFVLGGRAGPIHGKRSITIARGAISHGGADNGIQNLTGKCGTLSLAVNLATQGDRREPFISHTAFSTVVINFQANSSPVFDDLFFAESRAKYARISFAQPVRKFAVNTIIDQADFTLPGGWGGLLDGIAVSEKLKFRVGTWRDVDFGALQTHASALALHSLELFAVADQFEDAAGSCSRLTAREAVPVTKLVRTIQALGQPEITLMGGNNCLGQGADLIPLNLIQNPEELCASPVAQKIYVYLSKGYGLTEADRFKLCGADGRVSPGLLPK